MGRVELHVAAALFGGRKHTEYTWLVEREREREPQVIETDQERAR